MVGGVYPKPKVFSCVRRTPGTQKMKYTPRNHAQSPAEYATAASRIGVLTPGAHEVLVTTDFSLLAPLRKVN